MIKKNNPKIFWCHSHFLNWTGGSNFIFETAVRLAGKYDVSIVGSVFSAEASKRFNLAGLKTISLNNKSTNSISYWLNLKKNINLESENLGKIIKPNDILVTSMFPMNCIAERLPNPHVQICWEPYSLFHDENYVKGFGWFQRKFISFVSALYKRLDLEATNSADKIVTLSEYNKKWISQVYRRKDSIISYEGVDLEFFKKSTNPDLKVKYGKEKVIFHSTDFTKIKGTEFLFKAMPYIKGEVKNVMLLISNTLSNKEKMEELTTYAVKHDFSDRIEFLGYLDYELLPSYLSSADVVVQPSIGQSMNLTIKEAMACGTSVITGPEGKEQYEDGTAGYLVDPRKTRELGGKIVRLLKNSNLTKKMGEQGRKIIENKFSWDSVYKRIDRVIEKVSKAQ